MFQKGNKLGTLNKGRSCTWRDKVSATLRRRYRDPEFKVQNGFQNGHAFLGDLSRPNYFQKGEIRYPAHVFQPGVHYSPATEFKKGRIMPDSEISWGAKSSLWIDGRSFYPYTPEFNSQHKRRIKDRDRYRCQNCDESSQLCVHHIDADKTNNAMDNLVTLCRLCHRGFHWILRDILYGDLLT